MKQCTEKGDDKTKLDTTAINTYGTYMRNFRTRKQLQNLKAELTYLADNCHGDDRPNCPILDALSKK